MEPKLDLEQEDQEITAGDYLKITMYLGLVCQTLSAYEHLVDGVLKVMIPRLEEVPQGGVTPVVIRLMNAAKEMIRANQEIQIFIKSQEPGVTRIDGPESVQ
jgi:hypothetical protein